MNSSPSLNPSGHDRLWVAVQSLLLLATIGLGVGFRGQWQSVGWFWFGVVLFSGGAWLGIWGVRSLGPSRTPTPSPTAQAEFVRHGSYRHIRHPLYASVMLASFGWGLLWQSFPALGMAIGLSFFLDGKARLEERLMARRFGEYEAYRQKTWRFIPGVY